MDLWYIISAGAVVMFGVFVYFVYQIYDTTKYFYNATQNSISNKTKQESEEKNE